MEELRDLTAEINALIRKHEELLDLVIERLYRLDLGSSEYEVLEAEISDLLPNPHKDYYVF